MDEFCDECYCAKDALCRCCHEEHVCRDCEEVCFWCWMALNGNLEEDDPRMAAVKRYQRRSVA